MIYSRFQIFGEQSADAYVGVFQAILYTLEDRLEEEWETLSSVVNLKNIMAEKLSTSDYTALWLVQNHIIKVNKIHLDQMEADMQSLNRYRDKLITFIFEFYNEIFKRKSNESYIHALAGLFRGDEQEAIEQRAARDPDVENLEAADQHDIDNEVFEQNLVAEQEPLEQVLEEAVEQRAGNHQEVLATTRPRRQRRPPERLNIFTTKGRTYKN